MGLHDPFGHLKHKLWPKEGLGVELTIWLPTTKIRKSPRFPCVQVVCHIPLQSSRQGLQFFFNLISIWGLQRKLWAPKVVGVPSLGISGLSFGSPKTKCHLDAGIMPSHKVYYKGESGGFPRVQAVVSLVNVSLPVAHPNTKSIQIMH
jgi:hypothetical protein